MTVTVVGVLATLVTATACEGAKQNDAAKPTSTRATSTATTASSPSPTRLQTPGPQPGEIARVVYSRADGSVIATKSAQPRPNTSYVLRGECAATSSVKSVAFRVTTAADPQRLLTAGGITCGGGDVTVTTAVLPSNDPAAIQVALTGPLDGVSQVYAVLVPSPS